MTTAKRFVVFNDDHLVFLGFEQKEQQLWSRYYKGTISSAPTFLTKEEVEEYVSVNSSSGIPEFRLIQVFADLPGDRTSKDACANSQLPRW